MTNRILTIRDIAEVLAKMEDLGSNEMGNLTYNEAMRFHAATNKLRRLVDGLMQSIGRAEEAA